MADSSDPEAKLYVTDEDLEAAKMEAKVYNNKTPREVAQGIIDQNVVHAAMSVVRIARQAHDPRLRFAAAKEVLNRGLGPVTATSGGVDAGALEKLLKDLTSSDS
jgi:hypothetical protein